MLITVYITTYNNCSGLNKLLNDFLKQTVDTAHIVVVDAKSTDDTNKVLLEYSSKLNLTYISESDRGIYYGLNKAINLMSNSHCVCIGSDDRVFNKCYIEDLTNVICDSNVAYYTDIILSSGMNVRRKSYPEPETFKTQYGGLAHLHHQSVLIPYWVLNKLRYNTTYPTYADLDLMLKAQSMIDIQRVPIEGVVFNAHGYSSTINSAVKRYCELTSIRRSNGLAAHSLRTILSSVRQLF